MPCFTGRLGESDWMMRTSLPLSSSRACCSAIATDSLSMPFKVASMSDFPGWTTARVCTDGLLLIQALGTEPNLLCKSRVGGQSRRFERFSPCINVGSVPKGQSGPLERVP